MEKYMTEARKEARIAYDSGEVPIGAVLVRDGQIVAAAHNTCEAENDATAHAELLAIRRASATLGSWRLSDCTLYVTMEPCPMCAGAILAARIPKVVFGVKDPAKGAFGSVIDLTKYPLGAKPEIVGGCGETESLALLRRFFSEKRSAK